GMRGGGQVAQDTAAPDAGCGDIGRRNGPVAGGKDSGIELRDRAPELVKSRVGRIWRQRRRGQRGRIAGRHDGLARQRNGAEILEYDLAAGGGATAAATGAATATTGAATTGAAATGATAAGAPTAATTATTAGGGAGDNLDDRQHEAVSRGVRRDGPA